VKLKPIDTIYRKTVPIFNNTGIIEIVQFSLLYFMTVIREPWARLS